jgi:hypothetical protein
VPLKLADIEHSLDRVLSVVTDKRSRFSGSGTHSVKDLEVSLLGGGYLSTDQHQHRAAGTA